MRKSKLNISVGFKDHEGKIRFLFRVLNYGKSSDELKFSFNKSRDYRKIIHTDDNKNYPFESIIRNYAELSYHKDGTLMWKYSELFEGDKSIINNPHGEGSRRTPLANIGIWETIFMSNIIRYNDCSISSDSNIEVIEDKGDIFNGEPFEYHVFLGNIRYQTPPNNQTGELVYRINDITYKLDMIIWVRKSSFYGEPFMIGNKNAINNNNRIKICEPKLQIEDGSVQIDLRILINTKWAENIVNDKMKLNVDKLKRLPPMTKFCKSYLKDNPYLNQLIELIGFNKGFSVSVFYDGVNLNHKMTAILDKDEKGEFIGIGSNPPD
ncbi:MAG: hypothetical protein JXA68_05395 [Ignavibacteriales bacterium]|nr:hypothetical protein [Ignavibacteriales bacterium]